MNDASLPMSFDLFNPHRYWDDQADPMLELDARDAELDREDSLSDRYAFQLGESLGLLRLDAQDGWPSPEMERGYRLGLSCPARHGDIHLRKLLTLRRNAFARGIPVAAGMTVDYLRRITVAVCPVSGEVLSQGMQSESDCSLDRLENSLGYVPGNVCFVSRRVNELKGRSDFESLADAAWKSLLQDGFEGLTDDIGNGLSALEALRLAALMAAPSALSKGKLARFAPLAMAPGIWATPEAAIAGLHCLCARARVPGAEYEARTTLFKRLGKETWRASNRLVEHVVSKLRRGTHPADIWLDGLALELLMLLSSELLRTPPDLPNLTDESILRTMASNASSIMNYWR